MKRDLKTECSECGGRMTAGSLVDYRRNAAAAGEWVPGDVVASAWTGALKNSERYVTNTLRCDDCGFLKIYAREAAPPRGVWG